MIGTGVQCQRSMIGAFCYGGLLLRANIHGPPSPGESLKAQRRQVMSYATAKGLALPEENVLVEAGDDND